MKLRECVLGSFVHGMVDIGSMQFKFATGLGTTDAIFTIRHIQEKNIVASVPLYTAFVGKDHQLGKSSGRH